MDPTIQERGTFPAQRMIDSFFADLPTDMRFTKTTYQQIVPHTAIDKNSKTIEFILDRLDAPFCYLLSDMLMMVTVIITKSDGTSLPETVKVVAPCNNMISSLFASNVMKINDDQITASGELYPYKCYLQKMLTFSTEVKACQLLPSGYMEDLLTTSYDIEAKINNFGFENRSAYFRKNFQLINEYRPEGATLVGTFKHDLSGCDKPMPPGTKVSFNLYRSEDSFFLMKKVDAAGASTDTENYKAVVSQCCLFVKVATMSEPIYRELSTRFAKEDIKYHYRKIIVKPITVPASNQEFMTGNLFPDSENPCKLHFVLVKTSARTGDYKQNPFGFYRKWKVTKASGSNISAEVENYYLKDQITLIRDEMKAEREKHIELYKELLSLQRSQYHMQPPQTMQPPQPSTSRGKGKTIRGGRDNGPKNTNLRSQKHYSESQSELTEEMSDNASFVSAQSDLSAREDIEAQLSPLLNPTPAMTATINAIDKTVKQLETTTETIYLKSFALDVNSSPIDQVL